MTNNEVIALARTLPYEEARKLEIRSVVQKWDGDSWAIIEKKPIRLDIVDPANVFCWHNSSQSI